LPEETVHLLGELGVQRIDQLLALPRGGLTARFGPQLITRIDQATGALEGVEDHRPGDLATVLEVERRPVRRPGPHEQVVDFLGSQGTCLAG